MRPLVIVALATSLLSFSPASASLSSPGHRSIVSNSSTGSASVGRGKGVKKVSIGPSTTSAPGGRRGGSAPTTTFLSAASLTSNVVPGVTLCTSPGCVQPSSNVLFDTSMTGNPVNGTLNDNPAIVIFTGNESLTTTASNGQARISGADGNLTQLTFGLANGATFNEVEFNLNALADGFVTLTFLGTGGTTLLVTDPLAISINGQNYFGGFGGAFTSVNINSTVQLGDVRQVRLGGIAAVETAVPEAGTWAMMLLGFGAVGYGMRKSRRRSTKLALATA